MDIRHYSFWRVHFPTVIKYGPQAKVGRRHKPLLPTYLPKPLTCPIILLPMNSLPFVIIFALVSMVVLYLRRKHKWFAITFATVVFVNLSFISQYLFYTRHYALFGSNYFWGALLVVFIVVHILVYRVISKRVH
jgi:hypothetical protein